MNELSELFSINIDAYLQGPLLLIALVGLGSIIGVMTGLFGVGGAFLLNPLLMILLGIQETMVVGASMCFTIGTGAAGAARHWRAQNIDFKTTGWLVAGALPCVLLGKFIHESLRDGLGPGLFPAFFRIFYLLILLLTAWIVFRGLSRSPGDQCLLQRTPIGPHIDLSNGRLKQISLPGLLLVGGAIGIIKGLLGIGGGVLFVPLLLVTVGLTMHLAVGTSLGVVVFSSIFGTILYGHSGQVNLLLVMSLLVGSTAGVQLGAWICHRLHAKKLQRSFGYVVLLAVLLVAIDLSVRLVNR